MRNMSHEPFTEKTSPSSEKRFIHEKIRELIRHTSRTRLAIHADSPEVSVDEPSAGFLPGRILATNMVFILISGDTLRLTFKVHFNTRTAKTLAFQIFGGKSPNEIPERQAIDYFKEYANLVAGSVISLFGKSGVDLGISLPLCTRGFNEIFADYSVEERLIPTYCDFWSLRVNGQTIHCGSFFEILNWQKLSHAADLAFDETAPEDDDGDLDFL